jgi:hypothetical protein
MIGPISSPRLFDHDAAIDQRHRMGLPFANEFAFGQSPAPRRA